MKSHAIHHFFHSAYSTIMSLRVLDHPRVLSSCVMFMFRGSHGDECVPPAISHPGSWHEMTLSRTAISHVLSAQGTWMSRPPPTQRVARHVCSTSIRDRHMRRSPVVPLCSAGAWRRGTMPWVRPISMFAAPRASWSWDFRGRCAHRWIQRNATRACSFGPPKSTA